MIAEELNGFAVDSLSTAFPGIFLGKCASGRLVIKIYESLPAKWKLSVYLFVVVVFCFVFFFAQIYFNFKLLF